MNPKTLYKKALMGETYQSLAVKSNTTRTAVRSKIARYYTSRGLPSPTEYSTLSPTEQSIILSKLTTEEREEPQSFVRILESGEREIDDVINATAEDLSDKEFLLAELGLDIDYWNIKEASLSRWGNANNKQTSVRVRVSPKVSEINYEEMFINFSKYITPLEKKTSPRRIVSDKTVVIPLFDLHMQESEKDYMDEIFAGVDKSIDSVGGSIQKLIIIFGGDGLEHDNFNSTTEMGTRIDDTDIQADYEYLFAKLADLINMAIEHAESIDFVYLRGNHSPSLDWAVSHGLSVLFRDNPKVKFDLNKDNLVKATQSGAIFIGMYHGHKNFRKGELTPKFITKFPQQWAETKCRIIFSGHYHTETEAIQDVGSAMHHQQPSPKKPNNWANQNNFVSHFVGVKVYVFSKDRLLNVHYVQGE